MRKIKLCQLTETKGRYKVFVDSEHKNYFTNKKRAVKFQNDINTFLTETLFQLNDLYIDFFTLYRRLYFTIENPLLKRNLETVVKDVNVLIDNALNKSSLESIGSSYVVSAIDKIFLDLINGYQTIRTVVSKRSDTLSIYHTEIKIKNLTLYYHEFEKFQIQLNDNKEDIEIKIIKIA